MFLDKISIDSFQQLLSYRHSLKTFRTAYVYMTDLLHQIICLAAAVRTKKGKKKGKLTLNTHIYKFINLVSFFYLSLSVLLFKNVGSDFMLSHRSMLLLKSAYKKFSFVRPHPTAHRGKTQVKTSGVWFGSNISSALLHSACSTTYAVSLSVPLNQS